MTDNVSPFSKDTSGNAKDWTPRQALLKALTEADNYTSVVIVMGKINDDGTAETRQFNASASPFERDGLIMTLIGGNWE